MNINRNLKLTGEVNGFQFHAEPITYATFTKNIALLSELKKSLVELATPQDWCNIAFVFFKQLHTIDDILDDAAKSFINAIGRDINVYIDDKSMPLETLLLQKKIDDETADLIYSDVIFFTLMLYLPLPTLTEKMDLVLKAWLNCQTTLLNCTAFFKSLSTSTITGSSLESQTA